MESDDDYQSFSTPEEPSPPVQHRKLKRLKKAIKVSNDPRAESTDEEDLSIPLADSFKSQGLEAFETPGSEEWIEPLRSPSPSQGFDFDNDLNSGIDGLHFSEDRKETKRALDFDDMSTESDGKKSDQSAGVEENIENLKMERSEKKRLNEEDSNENKEKKKKRVKSVGDAKPKPSSKRSEEKERKNYLQQLHVESQRLLRETRDATFKPIPVVHKPISSILEKIRQRKLEMLKKTASLNTECSFNDNNGSVREGILDHDSKNISFKDREVNKFAEVMQEETIACHIDVESNLDASHVDGSKEDATQLSHENTPSQMALDEQPMHAFRAPVDDTQDLFYDSQTSEGKGEMSNDQISSPLEEVLAPSLLAMNLKFDSAPPDDISSDDEDNEKENVDPEPDTADNGCSSPRGDPVKAFVDDEAVEEDDSDNDLLRFQENEEDENEDYEELKDMIATGYEERPIDNERRNELHQKWLEQQDTVGTENLLQRLKYGSKLRDTTLLEDEEEEDEDDEDEEGCGDEAAVKTNLARINSRKAKQMIPHIFSDKNDGYVSSDGEEAEKRLVKQRLLDRAVTEEQGTLPSPVEDDSSREVFGLIKKLNTMPEAKKKAKTSSFFDKMLTGGNNNGSLKSSFLGRARSHSLPSSHKQGKSKVRSFIFERDDSNSRSSISMSEDSSDAIPQENRPTRNATSKFSSSQSTKFSYSRSKSSIQSTKNAAETVTGASLFEILKRSSMQSIVSNQDNMVGLTQTVFAAFKIPKKPMKIEGRT